MVREIDLEQVALNLEAAVRDVRDGHHQLVVVHKGQRIMAMIPVEFYDRWFAEREKAFQYFDEARARHIQYSFPFDACRAARCLAAPAHRRQAQSVQPFGIYPSSAAHQA